MRPHSARARVRAMGEVLDVVGVSGDRCSAEAPHSSSLPDAGRKRSRKAQRPSASPYASGFLLRREERARDGGGGTAGTCWDLTDRPAWEIAAVRRREEREFARENWERECAQRNRAWAGIAPSARTAMLQEARRDPREFIETTLARHLPF